MMVSPTAGGVDSWGALINNHHEGTVCPPSSLISAIGTIVVYVLLNLIQNVSGDTDQLSAEQVGEFLANYDGNLTQSELTYCAHLLVTLSKTHDCSQRQRESFAALFSIIISFGLGLMILIILSGITLICYPIRQETVEETAEQRRHSRGFQLLSLGLMLKKYHVRLSPENECEIQQNTSRNYQEDVELNTKAWIIPLPGMPNNDDTDRPRRVLCDRCPICLEGYKVNEKVAYSSNPNCIHTFHETCILSWMLPEASVNQQCPCCRQTFLSLDSSPRVAKKVLSTIQ